MVDFVEWIATNLIVVIYCFHRYLAIWSVECEIRVATVRWSVGSYYSFVFWISYLLYRTLCLCVYQSMETFECYSLLGNSWFLFSLVVIFVVFVILIFFGKFLFFATISVGLLFTYTFKPYAREIERKWDKIQNKKK